MFVHLGRPLDRRMGTTSKDSKCKTCEADLTECSGHFGHLQLTLPVFHQGYFKAIIAVLNCVCKTCSRLLLPANQQAVQLQVRRRWCACLLACLRVCLRVTIVVLCV